MNTANNTLALRDIHLPTQVSWWPPAPGWWLVLGIILLFIVVAVLLYRRYQVRKLYQAATQELQKIKQDYAQTHDDQQLVQQLSIYLRRACLTFYPRVDVAGLTGNAWLEFLDSVLENSKDPRRFGDEAARVLVSAPYQLQQQIDAEVLLSLCESWSKSLPTCKRVSP